MPTPNDPGRIHLVGREQSLTQLSGGEPNDVAPNDAAPHSVAPHDVGQNSDRALHARFAPLVNRLVWTFLGADPDRDDIAHDIYLRVFRGANAVRDPSRLEAWVVRVAMNCIKNEFRRRSFRRWTSWDAFEDPGTLRFHPDFEGREVLARTYRVLEQLPTNERMVLMLQLFERLDLKEIAKLCDCSLRTAKRRLKAGRERFSRLAERDPALKPWLDNSPVTEDE